MIIFKDNDNDRHIEFNIPTNMYKGLDATCFFCRNICKNLYLINANRIQYHCCKSCSKSNAFSYTDGLFYKVTIVESKIVKGQMT